MWELYLMHPDELFRNVARCPPAIDCDDQRHLLRSHGIEPWSCAPHRMRKQADIHLGLPLQSSARSGKNQGSPIPLDS